jgi:hypothetical protein
MKIENWFRNNELVPVTNRYQPGRRRVKGKQFGKNKRGRNARQKEAKKEKDGGV